MGVEHDYSLITKNPTDINNEGATLQGNSSRGSWECIQWGFYYYKDGEDPGGATYVGVSSPGEGDFFGVLSSVLDPYTKYWNRAYAKYKIWDLVEEEWVYADVYGDWVDFITHAYPSTTQVFACAVNKIAGTVTFYGSINNSDGGNVVERGFEYGLTKTPTWKVYETGSYSECVFSLGATELALATNFYVRAYLKSASGHYAYTNWRAFTTKVLDYAFVLSQLAGYIPNAYGFLVMFDENGQESNSIALPVGHDPSKITMDSDGIAYYSNYVNNADKYLSKRRLSDGVSLAHVASGHVRGISIGVDDYIYTLEGPWAGDKIYKRKKSDLSVVSYIDLVGSSYYGLGVDVDNNIYVARTDTSPDKIEKYVFFKTHDLVGVTTYEDYNIIAVVPGEVGTGSFKIAGNHISEFTAGKEVKIAGSTGNNGTYTISIGGAYLDGINTIIPVDEEIPDPTIDGTLTEVGIYSFEIAGDYTLIFTAGVSIIVAGSTGNDGTYTVKAGGSSFVGKNTIIPVDEIIPDSTVDGNVIRSGTGGLIASINSPVSLSATIVNVIVTGEYVYAGAWFDVYARTNRELNSIEKWTPSGTGWHSSLWFYGIGVYGGRIIAYGNASSVYSKAIAGYSAYENRLWFTEIVGGTNGLGGYPFAGADLVNIRAENNSVFARTLLYGEITNICSTIIERGFEYKIQDDEPTEEDTGTEISELSVSFGVGKYNLRNKELYDLEEDTVWWFRAYCRDNEDNKYIAPAWMKNLPTVITQAVTNINYNKVDGNGTVVSEGASELTMRGFEVIYEFSGRLSDSWKFEIAGFEGELEHIKIYDYFGFTIIDMYWAGILIKTVYETYNLEIGAYSITIGRMVLGWPVMDDCLIEGKSYKCKAFAENEFGRVYGEEVDFSTPPRTYFSEDPPIIGEVTVIKNENIENLPSGITATRRGFRYGTTEAADEFDVHENGNFTNGPYSMMLVDLLPDTTYYIVAYIIVDGIIYEGDMEIITTDPEGTEDEDEYPTPHYSPHGQDYREIEKKIFAEVLASQGIIDFSGGKKTLPITNHLIQTNPNAKVIADNYLNRFKLAKTRMEVRFPTPLPFEREDTVDFSFGALLFKENDEGIINFKEDGEGAAVLLDQISMIIKKINSVGLVKTEESIEYVAVLDLEHE